MIRLLVSLGAAVVLAGCTSSTVEQTSAGSAPATNLVAPGNADTANLSVPTDVATDSIPSPQPSDIVDNYDTATCADWLVTGAQNRQIVATYFMVKANNPKVTPDLELAVETAITTACKNVDPSLTVTRVALLSIKTLGDSI